MLIVLVMITVLSVTALAEDEPLTCKRAVLIDDYQVVLEFSEPICVNYYGVSSGPYYAIRVTDSGYVLSKTSSGENLQWAGLVRYVDEKHDRLLFTVTYSRLGIESIPDIIAGKDALSTDKNPLVAMCIEETESPGDSSVYNITSADGKKFLQATRTGGYDGLYAELTKDYSYKIDVSKLESVPCGRVQAEVYVDKPSEPGTSPAASDVTTAAPEKSQSKNSNTTLIAVLCGAAAVLAVAAAAVVVISGKSEGKK